MNESLHGLPILIIYHFYTIELNDDTMGMNDKSTVKMAAHNIIRLVFCYYMSSIYFLYRFKYMKLGKKTQRNNQRKLNYLKTSNILSLPLRTYEMTDNLDFAKN